MQKILIVEDEARIAHWAKSYFERAGFEVCLSDNGRDGLLKARQDKPDLVVLDLMLPELNGLDVCKALRQESNVPIIMLTAKGQPVDRILGLELGADDYVVKPFDPDELVSRARAVLRRTVGMAEETRTVLSGAGVRLDVEGHTCHVRGREVSLSRTQFALLELFLRHNGRVLTREQLLDGIFAEDFDGFDRAIDVHIRRLRRKIEENPAKPKLIVTVFGVGYKLMLRAHMS